MNRDDVIRMALECDIPAESDTLCRFGGWVEPLERFAALVAAAEREACAKLCDARAGSYENPPIDGNEFIAGYLEEESRNCAAAIRHRQ